MYQNTSLSLNAFVNLLICKIYSKPIHLVQKHRYLEFIAVDIRHCTELELYNALNKYICYCYNT